MPRRIAGISAFFWNGIALSNKGDCEYQTNSTKRDPIMDGNGTLAGWSEVGEAPYISCTGLDIGTFSVGDLHRGENVQIVVQLANGKTITGHSMTMMDPPKVKNADATFDAKWIGVEVNEGLVA